MSRDTIRPIGCGPRLFGGPSECLAMVRVSPSPFGHQSAASGMIT
jgi:hypothetical protein